jgi:chromate transporter
MTQPAPSNPPDPVSFYQAFRYWLKLGFISFGGPAGQIAIMHHDLVEKKRWISDQRFLHALNYCMLLPGPEAQQLAIYIGWLMHKTWGGIMAGVLFVLPSFFILLGLSWAYMAHGDQPAIAGILYGIKPAVVAIVLFAAYRIGSRTLKNRLLWAFAISAFVAIAILKLPFPLIILMAAFLGVVGGRFIPAYFIAVGHGGKAKHYGVALIDDHTPTPPHALFSMSRMLWLLAVGFGLWLMVMGLLLATQGWQSTLTQMGWFFTKAALLTFGGAYAVLPYIYQGAVEHFQWLNPTQMIDGLALGETTPGPLIMVVTYVGFVGGWTSALMAGHAPFVTAFLAATVVTFFTFLPSFVLIFIGAPFIETTHGKLRFTAPLTAITAAVVGVILNLAAFFAYHTFWPHGWNQRFDWFSAVLGMAALWLLLRPKTNVMIVIVICGLSGLAYQFVA